MCHLSSLWTPTKESSFTLFVSNTCSWIDINSANNYQRENLHGIKVARSAPQISHLFFAYGRYIFFKTIMEETKCMINCVNKYEETSGQKANFDKSSISSSANVFNELTNVICEVLGMHYTTNHGNYLGLSSVIGRNKSEVFDFIKEKA